MGERRNVKQYCLKDKTNMQKEYEGSGTVNRGSSVFFDFPSSWGFE
jgi:hypothetical protein